MLRNGLLLLVALLVALFAGELLVRVSAPQQLILKRPDIWRPDSVLGWAHIPNTRTTVNTGESTVAMMTDVDGFRVGSRGRLEGQVAILLLGDSFVEALQVPYERSFAGLLEARLPASLTSTVAVRNAGVGGWAPDQYLLRARQLIANSPADLVVVSLYVGNDAIDFRRSVVRPRVPAQVHPPRMPRRLQGKELVDALLYPIDDALEVRSHLYILSRNQLYGLRMRLGLSPQPRIPALERSEASSLRWSNTATICDEIVSLARTHGIPTLFVLIPTPQQVDHRLFEQYIGAFGIDSADLDIDQPSRLLGEALRSRGMQVIDVLPSFREASVSGVALYGRRDPHLSAAGHDLLARAVEARALELLRTPSRQQIEKGTPPGRR